MEGFQAAEPDLSLRVDRVDLAQVIAGRTTFMITHDLARGLHLLSGAIPAAVHGPSGLTPPRRSATPPGPY